MHPMQAIAEQGMTQVAKDVAIRSGAMSKAAGSLFGAFVKAADNQRTRAIYSLVTQGFTIEEFEEIERQCAKLASEADKANGFTPEPDAKGRAKYGPKQSTMASRGSERRVVFGVFKLHMAAIVSPGPSGVVNPDTLPNWEIAVQQARAYLHSNKLNWQGESSEKLTGRKQLKIEYAARDAAREQIERENPQKVGETIEAYYARVAPLVAEAAQARKSEATAKVIDETAAKLIQEHGMAFCVKLAECILKAQKSLSVAQGQQDVAKQAQPAPAEAATEVGETAEA
jgi:hypothetical protein